MREDKKRKPKKTFTKKRGLLCMVCRSVICSWERHDFRACVCGAIFVDGGDDYFRCGGTGIENREYKDVIVQFLK